MLSAPSNSRRVAELAAVLATPAMVIFVSSNFVNVGNLAFNMIFSRWMGPELFGDLALVLTIKLALLVVIGSVQMAVSQIVAGTSGDDARQTDATLAQINRCLFVGLWFLLPVVAAVLWMGDVGAVIGLGSPVLLLILATSLPFAAPLSILRGVVFGRQNTRSVVYSANLEMGTRLLGAVLAWQLGMGIEGVVAAIAVSIVAGWAALAGALGADDARPTQSKKLGRAIIIAALPFGVLQISQVIALDGDIFLVSAFLPEEQAGYVGALSLFQRIQFFACFALASVLLPSVVSAQKAGQSVAAAAAPVAMLFLAVAAVFVGAVIIMPETLITLLVGPDFGAAVPALGFSATASVAFTASFLMATFLAALGDNRGIWCAAGAALVQMAAMAFVATVRDASFVEVAEVKAICQIGLLAALFNLTLMVLRRP